jgi:predicted N-acyltransferase
LANPNKGLTLDVRVLDTITQCLPSQWDSLFDSEYPFLRHRFLSLLESSGSVGAKTGWEPKHILLEQDGLPVAAMPLYLKHHSWGEYVFDHSWADAYHDHGITYYPKLVTAIPFTPATGPRIGLTPDIDSKILISQLLEATQTLAKQWEASSWHILFPKPELANKLASQHMMQRSGVQYHWHNNNYENFNDFITTFPSRKRKNVLRERRTAHQNLRIKRLVGEEITSDWWEFFHIMYQRTYLKRSGTSGYLTESFFHNLGKTMGNQVMMCIAECPEKEKENNNKAAAALFFYDNQTLYGRYWGCQQEYDFLHFELCYYQGIEFAIEQQLSRFDAGAQGEHKIKRGFKPVETYSSHWINHSGFSEVIQRFLNQETRHIKQYISQACEQLPYKILNK